MSKTHTINVFVILWVSDFGRASGFVSLFPHIKPRYFEIVTSYTLLVLYVTWQHSSFLLADHKVLLTLYILWMIFMFPFQYLVKIEMMYFIPLLNELTVVFASDFWFLLFISFSCCLNVTDGRSYFHFKLVFSIKLLFYSSYLFSSSFTG